MPRLFPQGRHCTQSSSLANRKLIDKANYWLKNNPEVAVKGCETITWMGSDVTLIKDGDQMVLSKKLVEGAVTVYSRGLRCVEDLKINFRQIFLFMFLFSFKMSSRATGCHVVRCQLMTLCHANGPTWVFFPRIY